MNDLLRFLQGWYLEQCDGDWEHEFGIRIDNLDNPGWSIAVDLTGTPIEGTALAYTRLNEDLQDWVHAWSDGRTFEAATGPLGLLPALQVFRNFASSEQGAPGSDLASNQT